ncbi:MAG: sialidase, partial [Candidatus Limnocylindria bacterium]
IDVFARGQDGQLWHRWYVPAGWQDWEQLPVRMTSDPSACAWGPNRIDVFATGTGGDLLHAWWDGERWSWEG